MSAVIFATDPTGNNNPFLKIVAPATRLLTNIQYDNATNATLHYSADGVTWNLADIGSAASLLALRNGGPVFGNGDVVWVFNFFADPDNLQVALYSTDGKTYTTKMTGNHTNNNVNVVFNAAANQFTLTCGAATLTITSPNPVSPRLVNDTISQALGPRANPGLPGPQPLDYQLPGSFTAARYGFSGNSFGFFNQLDLTTTPITDAIVSSGAGWPAAVWTTVFDQVPTGVNATPITPSYAMFGS